MRGHFCFCNGMVIEVMPYLQDWHVAASYVLV